MPAADPNALLHGVSVTTLYYIFSTIPQTLAGAFAFLGAFVLFRVQSQNRAIEDACKGLFRGEGPSDLSGDDVRHAYIIGDGAAFHAAIKNLSSFEERLRGNPNYHISDDVWDSFEHSLNHNLNTKKQLFKHFKWSLILTSFSILVPIFLLLCSEKLSQHTPAAYSFAIIAICLTAICFATYIWIIIRALADK